MRHDDAEIQGRHARPRDEERERVRPERDAEAHEPRPWRDVGERDRADAIEARDPDDAETKAHVPHEERRRDVQGVILRIEHRRETERESRRAFRQDGVGDRPCERESQRADGHGRGEAHDRTAVGQRTGEE